MGCVAIFTISSFLCGLAPNLGSLIFFRVLQGAGGGGLQPSEQAILADTFSPKQRGMAFAVYGIAVVMAPAMGPTIGGWITDTYTWRWIFFINIPVGILSLFLTYTLIQDPPYMKKAKRKLIDIDYIGLGLLALGLGTLQVVLDKGQRDDWFESNFVLTLTIISVLSLVAVIFWEWHHKDPIVDLKLYKDRTFAFSNLLMFMVGFALLGSTLLIPQFLQLMMGYTAETAGLALMPGGFVVIALLPLVGFLLSRYDARWLLVFGLTMLSLSLFHMTTFNLGISFRVAAWARVWQGAGLAFLFVPVNTAAYAFLPRDKNNAASGLMNLARNVGGSVGISLVTTVLARRAQFHQSRIGEQINPTNPIFLNRINNLAYFLQSRGFNAVGARLRAYAMNYMQLGRQATMLAYIDCFWILGITIMAMIPLVFLMKKAKPGEVHAH
jgi:DHA2 family multidrug resistance protein